MIRTYISLAIKYLIKQPSYSFLSIMGFSLAFAGVLYIYSHLSYQNRYDRHVETWNRVYRLSGEINLPDNENTHGLLGPRLAPTLKEDLASVENMTRLVPFQEKCIVTRGEEFYFEDQVYYADSTVFEVFPIPFIEGSPRDALVADGQVVISESIARKYFGKTAVIGEILTLNNFKDFVITGVTEDLPENIHHKMHILISGKSFNPEMQEMIEGRDSENFWRPFCYSFIMLREHTDVKDFEDAFPAFYEKYMAEFGSFLKADFNLIVTPLRDLHFTPQFSYDLPKGNRSYHYLLIVAGGFLLLISLLNYLNLFSASLASRNHSLGMFKVNGASRVHLLKILIWEWLVILLVSAAVAWFLFTGVHRYLQNWMEGGISASGLPAAVMLLLLGIIILVILSFFMVPVISRISRHPMNLLRGIVSGRNRGGRWLFGKGSVIIQITLSMILIILSMVITGQVRHMLKADTGFNPHNVVQVKLHAERESVDRIYSFKDELMKLSQVELASYSSNAPGESLGTAHFKLDNNGVEASKIVSLMAIDADYIPLMQMELKEGRNFDRNRPTDPQSGIILNEACIEFLGMGEKLSGKQIRNIEILGVLKSGAYNSLHEDSRPIAFYFETGNRGYMNVRLNTTDLRGAVNSIQEVYRELFQTIPFEVSFLDKTVEQMYRDDINQSKLLALFTMLNIVIANIGLFGLVALLNRQRTREIGIRKVNGALKWQVVFLLGKQLFIWVLLAVLIAVPVTWYITDLWLQSFASRVNFQWWVIPLGGLILLASVLITTGYMTLRSASKNPVDTLRYE